MPRTLNREPLFMPVARLLKGYASMGEIAAALGKSANTATARIKKPEDLTLGELRQLSHRLHIPKEELIGAIKW